MQISYPKLLFSAALALFVVVLVVNIGLSQQASPAPHASKQEQAGIWDTAKSFLSRLFSRNSITIRVGPEPPQYSFDPFQEADLFAPGDKIYIMYNSPITISNATLESQETKEKYTLSVVPKDSLYTAVIPSQAIPARYTLKIKAGKRFYETPLEVRSVVTSPKDSLQAKRLKSAAVTEENIVASRNQICPELCNWEFVFRGSNVSKTLIYSSGNLVFRSFDRGRTWRKDVIVTNPAMAKFDTDVTELPNGNFILAGRSASLSGGDAIVARIPSGISSSITTSLTHFLSGFDYPKIAVNPFNPPEIYIRGYNAPSGAYGSQSVGLFSGDGGNSFFISDRPQDIINSMTYGADGRLFTGRYYIYGGSTHSISVFDNRSTVPTADLPGTRINTYPWSPRFSTQSNLTWRVASGNPVLLVDSSPNSPYRGRIYALWAFPERIVEEAGVIPYGVYGYNYDVFLSYSDDSAETWSPRLKINDESGEADQFFPSASIDPQGRVHIAFVDHRQNPDREVFDVYYAYVLDGKKVSKNFRITESSFGPKNSFGFFDSVDTLTTRELGDYLKMVAAFDDAVYIAYPCLGTNDTAHPSGLATTAACVAEIVLPKAPPIELTTVPLHQTSFPNGDRVYTTSEEEKQTLIAQGGQESGNFGSINLTPTEGSFPLYRLVLKRTGTHFYGTAQERNSLLTQRNLLRNEGILGYVTSSGPSETKVFRMYSPTLDRYVLTHDTILRQTLLSRGFRDDFSFYIASGPGQTVPTTASSISSPSAKASTLSPSQPSSFPLSLKQGMNVFSSPLVEDKPTPFSSFASDCGIPTVALSRYDPLKGTYTQATTITDQTSVAHRISVAKDCTVTIKGDRERTPQDFNGIALKKGRINFLAAPAKPIPFNQIKGNCTLANGPLVFDTTSKSYQPTQTLDPGRGYLVIVSKDCTLGAAKASAIPAQTQTGAISSPGQFLNYFYEALSGR